jgi:hypothetical protein
MISLIVLDVFEGKCVRMMFFLDFNDLMGDFLRSSWWWILINNDVHGSCADLANQQTGLNHHLEPYSCKSPPCSSKIASKMMIMMPLKKNREHDCEIVFNGEIITRMIRLIDMLNRWTVGIGKLLFASKRWVNELVMVVMVCGLCINHQQKWEHVQSCYHTGS